MDRMRTTPKKPRVSLDRSIEQLRKQLAEFASFLGKGKPTRSLDEFDFDTERMIADLLGETSESLEAYEYAELGEAAGLVNMPDEAPEGLAWIACAKASCNAAGYWKPVFQNWRRAGPANPRDTRSVGRSSPAPR